MLVARLVAGSNATWTFKDNGHMRQEYLFSITSGGFEVSEYVHARLWPKKK
jgi:hypothetical protein